MKRTLLFLCVMMAGLAIRVAAQGCSSCGSFGTSGAGGDVGPSLSISLGTAQYGQSAGALTLNSSITNTTLFTPIALQYNAPTRTDVRVLTTNIITTNVVMTIETDAVLSTNQIYITNELSTPTVTVLAGNGSGGNPGSGPLTVSLAAPQGVVVDNSGNFYIVDTGNNVIRKVTPSGSITTIAGNGTATYSGDGGAATSASLNSPTGLALDSSGNLYIADTDNQRIRKVTASGIISTVAGNGSADYTGDGYAATNATVYFPDGVAVDSSGNLYIADTDNSVIRKVNTNGIISTVAGNGTSGYSGDSAAATSAELSYPEGVAVDGSGNIYIADSGNNVIREVNSTGIITTMAGNGSTGLSGDGGAATSASLYNPTGVALDGSGNLYMVYNDGGDHNCVRKVDTHGIITTLTDLFNWGGFYALALDASGNVYVADNVNNIICKVSPNGVTVTVAGNGSLDSFNYGGSGGYAGDGGAASGASLNGPTGVALDGSGNLYIADYGNNVVRQVSVTGTITTVAGNGSAGYSGNGGAATSASLNGPIGVTVDGSGNLYIADFGNNVVRKVNATGTITTVAGNGSAGYSGDGGAATSAKLFEPIGLTVDGSGNLFIADFGNNVIRKLNVTGTITTVAGNGSAGYSGDGGAATSAKLNGPTSVAVDSSGNLYIADYRNFAVRQVVPSGNISTLVGNGTEGDSGDYGAASSATINGPTGVMVDGSGALYIAENGITGPPCSVLREVLPTGIITTIDSYASGGFCGVAKDAFGNFYVSENSYNLVFKLGYNVNTIITNIVVGFTDVTTTNTTAILTTNVVIRQIIAPQTLADIPIPASTNGYVINFYYPSNIIGTNADGTCQIYGSPYITWLVTNANPTASFQLQISEFGINPNYGLIKQWTNTFSSATGQWSMNTLGGIQETMLTTNLDASTYQVIDVIQNPGGPVVQQVANTYKILNWSTCTNVALVTNTVGVGTAAKVTTYTYWDPATFGAGSLILKDTVVHPDGSWEIYANYDNLGRPTQVYSSFGDVAVGNTSNVKETDYTYDPVAAGVSGTGDNGTLNIYTPRLVVQKVQGAIVSESYSVYPSTAVSYQSQCTTPNPTAGWSDSHNLITTNLYYTSGPNQFELLAVQHPDGTLSTYNYFTNGLYRTNITVNGQPDSSDSYVVDGVSNVVVLNTFGSRVSAASYDVLSSGLTLSCDTYGNFDSFDRPQQVTHLDGTTEYLAYACCGLENTVDRDGVNTVFLYDLDKRSYGYAKIYGSGTNNPVTFENNLDAAGRSVQSFRVGTDGSSITLSQSAYDTAGRLIEQTNALNGATSYVESTSGTTGGLIRTITNPDGGTRVDAYYLDGSLKSVTGTAVHGKAYAYGSGTDINGNNCTFVVETNLDGSGNLTTEWTKTFTDMAGRQTEVLYADGHYSQSLYNSLGQLTNTVDPDTVSTLYAYNGKGQLAYTTLDTSHNHNVFDFSGTNRITQTTNDVIIDHGTTVKRLRKYVWLDGQSTGTLAFFAESSADGLNAWQTQYRDVSTPVTTHSQTIPGVSRTVTNTAPDGSYTVSSYSYSRLLSSVRYSSTGGQVGSTTYGYDAHSRQNTQTDARNGTTTLAFNSADLVVTNTTPNPGGSAPEVTTTTYNNLMQATAVTQPDGTAVNSSYLLTGELGLQFGSRIYPVGYGYDYAGRMKTMTNWSNFSGSTGVRVTTWNYDGQRGWLTNKAYADGNGPVYTYTSAGRLASRKWVRGITTSYGYDNSGAVSMVSYSDATPGVINGYDRLGRLNKMVCNGLTDTNAYNLANEVVLESFLGGVLNGLSITNGYDQWLRRTNLTALGSGVLNSVAYGYDNASRLATVSDGTNNATYNYVANSPLVSQIVFKQNSVTRMTTTKQYDFLNRLTQMSSAPSAAYTQPLTFNYNYNPANQRTQDTLADGSYWIYGYDSLGQVTNACKFFSDGTPVAGQQFNYAFDTIGNRTQTLAGGDATGHNLRTTSYGANNLNQITNRDVAPYVDVLGASILTNAVTVNGQTAYRKEEYYRQQVAANNTNSALWAGILVAGGQSVTGNVYVAKEPETFNYDADGNLTNDGRWAYIWDAENRLVTMTVNTNVGPQYKLSFGYDAKGRRIQKIVATNAIAYATNNFLYDGWNLVAETRPDNSLIRSYVWGTDLSGTSQGAGGVGGLLEISYYGSSTTNCFPAYDGNGNIMALVNAADGTVAANYDYAAFGEPIRITGVMARNNPFRFSTKYADDESDLLYYGYRYYKQSTGTWLNKDPFGEPGAMLLQQPRSNFNSGPNPYDYVDNNSINLIDPFGLDPSYGNPVSGPDGPVGPSDPYAPGGPYGPVYNPPPPSCREACVLKYVLGITVDTTVVVSGQPIITKRFVLPGSAEGTSIAGQMTDAILQDAKLPGRLPTISGGWKCCRIAYTKSASRFVSRWIPFVGWALLDYDLSGMAGCMCGCPSN